MVVVQQMIVLFLVMLVGLAAYKKEIITDETSKKLSSLVANVSNPALILSSVIGDNSGIQTETLIQVVIISMVMFAGLILISFIIPKCIRSKKEQVSTYKVMTVFSNIGFMGFPVISSIYGSGALLYASIFLLPYNLLIYTYGVQAYSTNSSEKKQISWKQSLRSVLNNGVIASVLAIIIFAFNIKVPTSLGSAISMIGGLTSPLSMMIIGASLALINFKELIKDKQLIAFSMIKLLVIPIISVLIIVALIHNEVIAGITVLMMAMPVGSMTAILAQEYGGDYELTSKGVALTTILSVVTIPMVFYLFQRL